MDNLEQPELPSRPKPETTGIDPVLKSRINWLVNLAVAALVTAVWGKVESCQNKDQVEAVKETASVAADKAEAAATADRKTYTDVKDKLEPTGEAVEDLDSRLRAVESRTKGVKPPDAPLPAAVTQPLPEPASDGGVR